MPRIAREEHARIRERIETGGESVAAVAATYGCSPANIYAILAKLRRAAGGPEAIEAAPAGAGQQLTFAAVGSVTANVASPPLPEPAAEIAPPDEPPVALARSGPPSPAIAPLPAGREPAPPTRGRAPAPRGLKGGYVLLMRTSDGEEAVNPFRSLEDLLSAAKPILRDAARSPEPVWFSIQAVDLAALEDSL